MSYKKSREIGVMKTKTYAAKGPNILSSQDKTRIKEIGRGIASAASAPAISAGGGIGGGPTGHPTPPGDFGEAIRAWVKDITGKRLPSIQRKVIYMLFSKILDESPLKSGAFISCWNFSEGKNGPIVTHVSKEEMRALNNITNKGARDQKQAELDAFVSTLVGNRNWKIYMTNGIPYSRRVEYAGWESGKKAYAPIRKGMSALPSIIKKAISE